MDLSASNNEDNGGISKTPKFSVSKCFQNNKAWFTLPNQPFPISFRYSRLWRPRSDDFSSWTERKSEKTVLDRTEETQE